MELNGTEEEFLNEGLTMGAQNKWQPAGLSNSLDGATVDLEHERLTIRRLRAESAGDLVYYSESLSEESRRRFAP